MTSRICRRMILQENVANVWMLLTVATRWEEVHMGTVFWITTVFQQKFPTYSFYVFICVPLSFFFFLRSLSNLKTFQLSILLIPLGKLYLFLQTHFIYLYVTLSSFRFLRFYCHSHKRVWLLSFLKTFKLKIESVLPLFLSLKPSLFVLICFVF